MSYNTLFIILNQWIKNGPLNCGMRSSLYNNIHSCFMGGSTSSTHSSNKTNLWVAKGWICFTGNIFSVDLVLQIAALLCRQISEY